MSGETEHNISGWTTDTLKYHHDVLRDADRRFDEALRDAALRFDQERDRRYTEVAFEREKALKIKETADLAALQLAREIQTYKDEKANELREQINSERGLYASKDDVIASAGKIEAMIAPLQTYVASQQGRSGGLNAGWGWIVGGAGLVLTLVSIVVAAMKFL